jgi:pilus assembly protein CpaB
MNNTVLRILSAILAIGALAVGLLAIKLSQGPSAPASTPVAAPPAAVPTVAVATSVRAIKAGQTIVASDIAVKGVQGPPADAFKDIPELLGRMAATDIPAGAALVPAHFAADSIAYMLKAGERAVGIQVDEVSSVGGFIKPGEHVDVLAYVPPTDERNNRLGASTVVIQDARVLTIGDASTIEQEAAVKAKSDSVSVTMAKETGLKVAAEIQTRRMNLKSAVLAVKEIDVNRLMTAATVGQVRLALRPPAAFDANAQLGQGQDKRKTSAPPSTTLDMTIQRPKDPNQEDGRKIIIQEGSKELEQGAQKNNRNSFF